MQLAQPTCYQCSRVPGESHQTLFFAIVQQYHGEAEAGTRERLPNLPTIFWVISDPHFGDM